MLFDLTDNHMNGFEVMVLQSEENADQIIRVFKNNYEDGDNPNDLLTQICNELGFNDADLFPASKTRIEKEISNYLMRY